MRLRGEDSTGGARLSILIYTQIITLAYSSPLIQRSSALFPGKTLSQIKPSTLNCSISSAVARNLSVLFVWYSTSQMSIRSCRRFTVPHSSPLRPPSLIHPSHFHASADFTSSSVWVLLSVSLCLLLSLLISLSLPLFWLQAEVLDSQRRSTGLNDGLVNGVTDNSAN